MTMELLHHSYLKHLMRFPSQEELYLDNPTSNHIANCIEAKICQLIKHYQGIHDIDIDTSSNEFFNPSSLDFLDQIYDMYSRLLLKSPSNKDLEYAFTLLKLYGKDDALQQIHKHVTNSNEHKYIRECISRFLSWTGNSHSSPSSSQGKIKVRFYGSIGTTGYATICRDIVNAIYGINQFLDISFIPFSVQNFNEKDDSDENKVLRSLCPYKTIDDWITSASNLEPVDLVVLHSVPDMWLPIVKREKRLSSNVKTIGITVFETNTIPPQWIPHLRCVDRVTVPNDWNRKVFQDDIHGLDVTFIPHPVPLSASASASEESLPTSLPQSLQFDKEGKYIFYTINEWNGRKGIELLIQSFVEEFSSEDNTVLFIKTHGDVPRDLGAEYIKHVQTLKPNPPTIILDYSRWSSDEIQYLHSIGHCFVTLTRSEGQGLGMCEAALKGKYIIASQYGGQCDYLKKVGWVPCREVPAYLCTSFDSRHKECLDHPCCKGFAYFIAAQQKWGDPDTEYAKQLMRRAYTERRKGNKATVKYIQSNFNANQIGSQFISYFLTTVVSYTRKHLPPLDQDPYNVSPELLLPLRSLIPVSDQQASFKFSPKKPKVLIVGCGYMGNFGDDCYTEMHKYYLEHNYDVTITNTQLWVDSEGMYRNLSSYHPSTSILRSFDHLVIGGGGLINNDEIRSCIFKVYYPYCVQNNIPISFISVGFGYSFVEDETKRSLSEKASQEWASILKYAESISVRSHHDRSAVYNLIPPHRQHRVKVAADVCYGVPSLLHYSTSPVPLKNLIIYIPTTVLCLKYPDVAYHIQEQMFKYPGSRICMIEMGGITSDSYPSEFIKKETQGLVNLFGDDHVTVLPGRFFSGPMLYSSPDDSIIIPEQQHPLDVVKLFEQAHCVISGRYHGLVMARAFKLPCWVGTSSLYKICSELEEKIDTSTWYEHYKLLKQTISHYKKYGKSLDPSLWDENDRNTCITDIHTNSNLSVSFIQNMTNQQLYQKRRELL